jgi:hypothetical protein
MLVSLFHIVFNFKTITFVYILRLSSDGESNTILYSKLDNVVAHVKNLHTLKIRSLHGIPAQVLLRPNTNQVSDAVKFNMADRVQSLTASSLSSVKIFQKSSKIRVRKALLIISKAFSNETN